MDIPDLWIADLAYRQSVEELDGVVSATATYLNVGKFYQTLEDLATIDAYQMAFTIGYAIKVLPTLGLGLNARYIYSKLPPLETAEAVGVERSSGVSFDIGLLYKPECVVIPFTRVDLGNNLALGMYISNIGPNIYYTFNFVKDPLPMNLRLGFAYDIVQSEYNTLTWVTDVNRLLIKRDSSGTPDEFYKAFYTTWTGSSFDEQIREFNLSTGFEYWYGSPKLIALRIGYFYEDPNNGNQKYLTLGAGLRYDVCEFDFSYIDAPSTDEDPLAEKFRFSLSVEW